MQHMDPPKQTSYQTSISESLNTYRDSLQGFLRDTTSYSKPKTTSTLYSHDQFANVFPVYKTPQALTYALNTTKPGSHK